MVKLPPQAAAAGFQVTLSNGPSFPHIGTEACDTPAHHQVENQKLSFDAGSGLITVLGSGSGPAQCITVGKDKDPDAHTPAVEVQACSPALASLQQFTLVAASGQLALKADASQCLDQDVSVDRVILYGCHDPGSAGNQGWLVNATSQHIESSANGLCMCVLPASS